MNSIDEKLWNYIDGTLPATEQQGIALLIEQDEVYRAKYNQLQQLNSEFNAMGLDEPSMAFTYNVMETIRTENAMKPLKATVNKRVITGIAAFFILTIAAMLVYVLSTVNWSTGGSEFKIPVKLDLKAVHWSNYFSGPVVKGFLFFDLVMGLFLLDNYLRRKTVAKGQ
ncbi:MULTISPECIES: hypothetical protein [unclassified Mucilaginibacter]|uniref:hypothetical protein n=1 Tax=unclassified Mucilaginibacter TaxID=2617802 RepID=UPI002AC9E890|nr:MULTISPECIES: hypothetical protein [unclassified Mucilaginibacter]MEB0250137.1 hypothetical protein [Mucilaginibacter sp. 5B2]MEB0263784.1 hypothetical protein [Mucilaginibacter sp. 10I4]MEB0280231.1 hypothetical protein [Mucilaginibacter sp. 10B2]MEB0301146.1 hypothetical protein [Mucilaginibacter sp. 5C4]WPX24360.1 hypothetical protein RHM67_03620 [Mucilaginibacter sp. 5C4]